MRDGIVGSRCSRLATGAVMGAVLWATPAFAEDTPPPAPPPAPPAEAAPPAAPPPAPAPVTPAVESEKKPPTASEAMPATSPEKMPPIDVGAWTRVGGIFQGQDASKLNDWHMSNAYVELHAGG